MSRCSAILPAMRSSPFPVAAALVLAAVAGLAYAAPVQAAPAAAAPRSCALVPMPHAPPAPPGPRATAVSNVIFLNDCIAARSCDLTSGAATMTNDSRTNVSAVAQQATTMEPWRFTTQEWDAMVACVRRVYAPFNVQIVTTEPPATTEYFEAMVAGRAAQLGFGGGLVGVAPFACGVIPNAISFAFANDYQNLEAANAADLCWTVAHEIAHVFGLQHKYDSRDPMTYLQPPLPQKLFLDESGPCGGNAARDCNKNDSVENGCPGALTTINSYRQIAAVFGDRPGTPPSLVIEAPLAGSAQPRGFTVRATAGDDVRVRDVALAVDGVAVSPLRLPPFEWKTDRKLAAGPHTLSLVATDFYGATTTVPLALTSVDECSGAATGCQSGQLCLSGLCIAGPTQEGGLGTRCAGPSACASGMCAADGEDQRCVESCEVARDTCPDGFRCLPSGGAGVCWPDAASGEDGGGCGCASEGTGGRSGGLPIALGLGFAALVCLPRRRFRSA